MMLISMQFDHSQEIISPDLTNIVTISGGALELPIGSTSDRPINAAQGAIRFNQTSNQLELRNLTKWVPLVTSSAVDINGVGLVSSATIVADTTANQVVDSLSVTEYRSAVYQIQLTAGLDFHRTTIYLIHDNVQVYISEVNTMVSNTILGSFGAEISSGNMKLLVTSVYPDTTIKLIGTVISV